MPPAFGSASRFPFHASRIALLAVALLLPACGDDDCDPAPAGDDARDLTAAQLNFLHGTTGSGCQQSGNCRLAERADLLFEWIADAGCPDVVTLQEIWSGSVPLITARLGSACPFVYEAALVPNGLGIDDEMVLSRYPVLSTARQPLAPGFRRVMHARIDHPLGPLDVYTTHLASGADGGNLSCDAVTRPCPGDCVGRGARVLRDCQALQMVDFISATHDLDTPALVTGDFNAEPGGFVYRQFSERGWIDAQLAAGNPECDPSTGDGCTSGREDAALDELESPASNQSRRIDYIFVIPPAEGFACAARLDDATDRDRDGTATRVFTDLANPFAPECGAAPLPICWPSDHEGVELDLNCG